MSENNPFKFIYYSQPYRANPFIVLDARPSQSQAAIERFASSREQALTAGYQPVKALTLQSGDCITAAEKLQNPLLRLTFDLMLNWPEPDDGELS